MTAKNIIPEQIIRQIAVELNKNSNDYMSNRIKHYQYATNYDDILQRNGVTKEQFMAGYKLYNI